MAKNKTTQTAQSVHDFIEQVNDPIKRKDSYDLVQLMEQQTGFPARMWGPSIIGFGSYHYKYDSGHEGDAPLAGFSPRSAAISLYVGCDFEVKEGLLKQLGKYKMSKACIYIKKLADIDTTVLAKMIDHSIILTKEKYPENRK
ncbi:DUF1801 domain-containing protein [Pedobacter steynii]|uniref:YdhG-like domain-containing protein n=1 Tax=Pedobacter steynii TaxID=430522 RepID=A0A1D7QQA4_9SPHI|nr:DUF1801 domain-containing protein [Pedobacter steynii]AOM80805.1 hypothetical protein BFS30_15325 [Pedobacter steynii]